ncbi:hypothetical protein [Haliangium sp.]|uniref:hypothetical protein n=1 Tax=Haliangium sp. TaxID=2663208 RepID=UPI003D0FE0B9
MNDRGPAPILRDATSLAGVLLETLDGCPAYRVLVDRVCRRALDLHESVILALADDDRHRRLLDADAALQGLRGLLGLARDLSVLSDDDYLGFAEQADRVGRQLGGWLRRLAAADTMP